IRPGPETGSRRAVLKFPLIRTVRRHTTQLSHRSFAVQTLDSPSSSFDPASGSSDRAVGLETLPNCRFVCCHFSCFTDCVVRQLLDSARVPWLFWEERRQTKNHKLN